VNPATQGIRDAADERSAKLEGVDSETARRVYIVGAGGSGKTRLARTLANALTIEPVELDLNPFADRTALAECADSWIVEGIFLYDIEPLLQRATTIVWLDLPRRVAQRRIVIRHAKMSALRRNRYKGLRLLVRFVRSMRHYYDKSAREPRSADDWDALSRALTVERLAPHAAKVVQLRTPREVRTFVRQFEAATAAVSAETARTRTL
jgi:adenylate kinase family enzyme